MSDKQRITVGPFTWEGPEYREPPPKSGWHRDEVWKLVEPSVHAIGIRFALKDYGPGGAIDAFSGWRLVSGGPFTSAGKWSSRQEAMEGVIPYLVAEVRRRVAEKRAYVAELEEALDRIEGAVA